MRTTLTHSPAGARRTTTAARRAALVAPPGALARALTLPPIDQVIADAGSMTTDVLQSALADAAVETLVYVPRWRRPPDLLPDLEDAQRVLDAAAAAGATHAVVLSSTAVYGSTHHHAGLVAEWRTACSADQRIAHAWLELEMLAASRFAPGELTVLRAAPCPLRGEADFFSRLLTSRRAMTVSGYDPTIQLLSVRDLAFAVSLACQRRAGGTFNIVPAAPVPISVALHESGAQRVALPWMLHRLRRAVQSSAPSAAQERYLRYHLTAAGDKSTDSLGFVPQDSSVDAIRQQCSRRTSRRDDGPSDSYDAFGLDREYIRRRDRGFLGFLRRSYWRVDIAGLERIPRRGGGVLVGMHRGFMPFDGVMTVLGLAEATGRVPRFLIHPGVGLRFPFLFNLMSKLGGMIACSENADRVLGAGQLLAIYPEGIRGAFTMYKDAHRIGPSWRNDCIVFALRHRVPIVPFVTVGSAEIFPIVGRINWHWWKKFAEWPFFPITATFPLIPIPLPSKWHTVFLEPIHLEHQYGPDAADHPAAVRAIAFELKRRMEAAMADLVRRRRSIFFGSLRSS